MDDLHFTLRSVNWNYKTTIKQNILTDEQACAIEQALKDISCVCTRAYARARVCLVDDLELSCGVCAEIWASLSLTSL